MNFITVTRKTRTNIAPNDVGPGKREAICLDTLVLNRNHFRYLGPTVNNLCRDSDSGDPLQHVIGDLTHGGSELKRASLNSQFF